MNIQQMLTVPWQTSSQLRARHDLDKRDLLKALKAGVESGELQTAGQKAGKRYALSSELPWPEYQNNLAQSVKAFIELAAPSSCKSSTIVVAFPNDAPENIKRALVALRESNQISTQGERRAMVYFKRGIELIIDAVVCKPAIISSVERAQASAPDPSESSQSNTPQAVSFESPYQAIRATINSRRAWRRQRDQNAHDLAIAASKRAPGISVLALSKAATVMVKSGELEKEYVHTDHGRTWAVWAGEDWPSSELIGRTEQYAKDHELETEDQLRKAWSK